METREKARCAVVAPGLTCPFEEALMSLIQRIISRMETPPTPGATPKPEPTGVSLSELEGKHVFNSEGFARSSDIPADHPDKAALIRATHAQHPIEIASGVHAYPMDWKENDIRAHWDLVKAQRENPEAFGIDGWDRPPSGKTSKLKLADEKPTPSEPPSLTPPSPTPVRLKGVQDFSDGGYWRREFNDRNVSGTSFLSNTPGSTMEISMARGVGNTSPNLVVRDSQGAEVHRFKGVETVRARFVFTEDGQLPASMSGNPYGPLALKAGETYTLSGAVTPMDRHPNANSNWFRIEVAGVRPKP